MAASATTVRARLQELRNQLETASVASRDNRAAVELDQSSVGRLSRMDALQQQAMAVAGQERRKTELARIEAALRRLDEGDYGYCVACGEEIAERRLEVDPMATTCIACAARN